MKRGIYVLVLLFFGIFILNLTGASTVTGTVCDSSMDYSPKTQSGQYTGSGWRCDSFYSPNFCSSISCPGNLQQVTVHSTNTIPGKTIYACNGKLKINGGTPLDPCFPIGRLYPYSTPSTSSCSDTSNPWNAWSTCNSTGQQNRTCKSGCTSECGGTLATQSCSTLDVPYWANLKETNIPIDVAHQGDTVLLRYGGVNLEGSNITYEVQVFNSSFVWYNPLTWFGSKTWNDAQKINGLAYEPLTLVGLSEGDKVRFNLTINKSGTITSNFSGNLTINSSSQINSNSPPFAILDYPSEGMIFKVNNSIQFNQSSYDEDDMLRITWNFGDGNTKVFENFASAINGTNAANTNHSYVEEGIYLVELEAKEMTRTQSTKDFVSITILKEGINVIPVVTSPYNLEVIGAQIVVFNISQSYVANCSDYGTIPLPDFNSTDNLLSCKYLHKPGNLTTGNHQRIYVEWNLDDKSPNPTIKKGNWTQDYNSVVNFTWPYLQPGQKNVQLNLQYYYNN